jgi:hypothetical protein
MFNCGLLRAINPIFMPAFAVSQRLLETNPTVFLGTAEVRSSSLMNRGRFKKAL